MKSVIWELRSAVRSLGKSRGFALVGAVTLALGIGANTAIFSVLNAVLLTPLPYRDPERIAMIWSRWTGWDKTWVSEAELLDYRSQSRLLHGVAAWADTNANLTGKSEPERVAAAQVTANLFEVLGVPALVGRSFSAEEELEGRDQVVVLSHGLWQRRFGGDRSLIGTAIEVNGRPCTVVGVMPPGFRLPLDYKSEAPTELWMPLVMDRAELSRGNHGLYSVARLAPGATAKQASAELQSLTAGWTRQGLYPEEMRFEAFAVAVTEEVAGSIRPALLMLLGAVGFLLLITCANVANLQLVRTEARQRELAIRAAIGAGRGRLLRQLLAESLVLSAAGGALGVALAWAAIRALWIWNPSNLPRVTEAAIDGRVLLFALGAILVTGLLFGLPPAFKASRTDLIDALKEAAPNVGSGRAGTRARSLVVIAEMALAVVLVIGAGLMLRSFWELQKIDPGFDAHNLLTLQLSLSPADYPEPDQVVALYDRLLVRVRSLPVVERAGTVRVLPLASTMGDWGIDIEGRVEPHGEHFKGDWQVASEGYLEAMKIRLLQGRLLSAADRADSVPVAVINQTMARRYWPGAAPIGARFRLGSDGESPWVEIVGVVADVRHNGITAAVPEKFYIPQSQFALSTGFAARTMTLVVRSATDPLGLVGPIRRQIRELDPSLPISQIQTMEQVLSASVSEPRFTALLLGLFAALSLILAAVGIYGVMAYLVSRRTYEIGIRMVLGATPAEIHRLVLRHGLAVGLIGVLLGIGLAHALSRFLTSLLYGISPTDPATFIAVPALLILVALCASIVPARRATRVDPMIALRAE